MPEHDPYAPFGPPAAPTGSQLKKDEPASDEPEDTQEVQTIDESGTLIEGNAAEVLDRVGDDKQLAASALEQEKAREKPRKGLVGSLEQIVSGDED